MPTLTPRTRAGSFPALRAIDACHGRIAVGDGIATSCPIRSGLVKYQYRTDQAGSSLRAYCASHEPDLTVWRRA